MRRLGPFFLLALLGSAPWLIAAAASGAGLGGSFQPTARDAGEERARPALETERWLYNPRERAATGLEALDEGRPGEAVEAFDDAAEAAPERSPERAWALFDAGAARLLTEREAGRALELLEDAAEISPPELAPYALYNLGNARLADGDPRGAIDAYRQALRLEPDLAPAKRNLEIAWTRLEARRPEQEPPPERPRERPSGEREPPADSGDPEQEPEHREPEQTEPEPSGPGEEPLPSEENRAAPASRPVPGEPTPPPLPRFREQPDMTAEQAAALLAAIDHLERSQRRQEAAERAQRSARRTTEKDW